jgi:hypothetical protein
VSWGGVDFGLFFLGLIFLWWFFCLVHLLFVSGFFILEFLVGFVSGFFFIEFLVGEALLPVCVATGVLPQC